MKTRLPEMRHPSDAMERALAHAIKGIKDVYNRAEYAVERRRILQLWSDFVDAQINGSRELVITYFGTSS
jgi:hypothetical protein